MIVMGVESSCDETGVGIVEWTPGEGDGPGEVTLLADEVASLSLIHISEPTRPY